MEKWLLLRRPWLMVPAASREESSPSALVAATAQAMEAVTAKNMATLLGAVDALEGAPASQWRSVLIRIEAIHAILANATTGATMVPRHLVLLRDADPTIFQDELLTEALRRTREPTTSDGPQLTTEQQSELVASAVSLVGSCMGHTEPRVRRACASLAMQAASVGGTPVAATLRHEALLHMQAAALTRLGPPSEPGSAVSAASSSSDSTKLLHESAGWKGLDSCMEVLRAVVLGGGEESLCPAASTSGGAAAAPAASSLGGLLSLEAWSPASAEPLGMLCWSVTCSNRFVREAAMRLLATVVLVAGPRAALGVGESSAPDASPPPLCVGGVCSGLQDNWSQVRLAAATAARQILLCSRAEPPSSSQGVGACAGGDEAWCGAAAPWAGSFLARLCFNRYYVADGVRNHAHATWAVLLAEPSGAGMEAVVRHMGTLVGYYHANAASENHNLRVTACHVIGELGQKMPQTVMAAHASGLVEVLIGLLGDSRWHVRGAACGALAKWAAGPSQEEAAGLLVGHEVTGGAAHGPTFARLLCLSSEDTWSVRESAAECVAAMASRPGAGELLAEVVSWCRDGIEASCTASTLRALKAAWDAGGADGSSPHQLLEEPPDVDYDSDGGRDDDTPPRHKHDDVAAAERPVPKRWAAASQRDPASPTPGSASSSTVRDPASHTPGSASSAATEASASPAGATTCGAELPSGTTAAAATSLRGQGGGLVAAALAVGAPDAAMELFEALCESVRRASAIGVSAGAQVTAGLRSARALLEAVGKRKAKAGVAALANACAGALSMETSSPASGTAARTAIRVCRAMVGRSAFDARLEPSARAALERFDALDQDDAATGSSLHAPAAMSVRVAEAGTLPGVH